MAFEFETASVGGHVQAVGSASVPADLPMPVLLVGQITLGVGPVSGAKIFPFCSYPNQFIPCAVPPDKRGGSRLSRTRGGMRWTRKP